jgi:hypothetical protein
MANRFMANRWILAELILREEFEHQRIDPLRALFERGMTSIRQYRHLRMWQRLINLLRVIEFDDVVIAGEYQHWLL